MPYNLLTLYYPLPFIPFNLLTLYYPLPSIPSPPPNLIPLLLKYLLYLTLIVIPPPNLYFI